MPQKAESPRGRRQVGSNGICLSTNHCVPGGHKGPEYLWKGNENNHVHIYTPGIQLSMLGAELHRCPRTPRVASILEKNWDVERPAWPSAFKIQTDHRTDTATLQFPEGPCALPASNAHPQPTSIHPSSGVPSLPGADLPSLVTALR